MEEEQRLSDVKKYIYSFYEAHEHSPFHYHNIHHTERVVEATKEIANHYQLNDRDFFIVVTAAWFHDTGYFVDAGNHEREGAELAMQFLKEKEMNASIFEPVGNCIRATKVPQTPHTLLEKIVCDADLYHLGTDYFSASNELLREEIVDVKKIDLSEENWNRNTIQFLKQHHYHTTYCQLLLNDIKKDHLKKLEEKLENITENSPKAEKKEEAEKNKKGKGRKLSKSVETMFKIASNNNQRLSKLADYKARNMITVNSIILSAVISLLLRHIKVQDFLTIPTIIILLVCLLTLIFSILATRPSLPQGKFKRADLDNRKVNLLFFGNFYKMELPEYQEGMQRLMDDQEFIYDSLIKDVYSQGIVLGRKYKLLRMAYNIFMFGLILSVLAFIFATIWVVH